MADLNWVTVTEFDIALGEQDDCFNCAFARAIKRRLPDDIVAEVTDRRVWFNSVAMELPDVAKKFIEDFDNGRPVYPVSIALELPEGVSFTRYR